MPAFKPLAVDVVGQRLHVGEARVRVHAALGVALRALQVGSFASGFTVQQSSMFTYW